MKPRSVAGFFVCGMMGIFGYEQVYITSIVLVVEISKAQFHIGETDDVVWPYITPGIQIGLNSGKGLFYSFQFTVGLIPVKYPIIPGMTIGKRYYFSNKRKNIAKETYTYKDIQISLAGVIGGGYGKIINSREVHKKSKLWIVVPYVPIVLISYDIVDFERKHKKTHWGVFGVIPLWTNFEQWYPL